MKSLIILISLLALTTVSSLFAAQKMRQKAGERAKSEQDQPQLTLDAQVEGTETKTLWIAISPKQAETDISAFTLQATVGGLDPAIVNALSKLVPSPDLVNEGWSFPISSVQKISDREAEVKLSGVHVSTTPFTLTGRQEVVSLPLGPQVQTASITFAVDREHTKLYRKDGTLAPLDENVTISVEEGGAKN